MLQPGRRDLRLLRITDVLVLQLRGRRCGNPDNAVEEGCRLDTPIYKQARAEYAKLQ
jgi:hypothetical protein